MVIGAVCRDALHAGLGYTTPLRATGDLDIGLAVGSLAEYEALAARLEPVASTSGIRFLVAGSLVDLVPFGTSVKAPDGVVAPHRHDGTMSVFGFQDVYDAAATVTLAQGSVRLPSVSGYALLKLKAWADRSPDGQYKDATDLACAMYWYLDRDVNDLAKSVWNRLWDTEPGRAHYEAAEHEAGEATVRLLVDDALAPLPSHRRDELRSAWDRVDHARFAANLVNDMLTGWPRRRDERLARYARAVRAVISATP